MDEQILQQQVVSGISGGGELSLYQYFIASPLFAGFKDFSGSDRKVFLGQYAGFSPPLKNYLASTETAGNILAIGASYQLDDGQVYQVATAIRELVIGVVFIKDFPFVISSKLGIDDIRAGEIANKIISQTFGPILEDVKRIQRNKFPDKIQRLQKETGKPEALAQSAARPIEPRQAPTPAQQVLTNDQRPTTYDLKSSVRPPETRPQSQMSQQTTAQPQNQPTARPQFKIPNLGPFDTAQGKSLVVRPGSPQVTQENGVKKSSEAQRSLEEELKKVANVIDLRNKP